MNLKNQSNSMNTDFCVETVWDAPDGAYLKHTMIAAPSGSIFAGLSVAEREETLRRDFEPPIEQENSYS